MFWKPNVLSGLSLFFLTKPFIKLNTSQYSACALFELMWIKLYLCLFFSFLSPELSKVAMSRRYGDLHLCVITLAWCDCKLKLFSAAPLGLSQTFMPCALATHQRFTKWAVFLDGLNFCFWKRSRAFFTLVCFFFWRLAQSLTTE